MNYRQLYSKLFFFSHFNLFCCTFRFSLCHIKNKNKNKNITIQARTRRDNKVVLGVRCWVFSRILLEDFVLETLQCKLRDLLGREKHLDVSVVNQQQQQNGTVHAELAKVVRLVVCVYCKKGRDHLALQQVDDALATSKVHLLLLRVSVVAAGAGPSMLLLLALALLRSSFASAAVSC
jgi:hypothetical protein